MRLIDADKLLKDGIRVEYGYNDNGLVLVPMRDVRKSIENAPTVDAVSRSEVANEVIDEIIRETDKVLSILSNKVNVYGGRANGKTMLYTKYKTLTDLKNYLLILKEKYIKERRK